MCFCFRPSPSTASYEDLELDPMKVDDKSDLEPTEASPLKKVSMKRLVRQASMMDTQKDTDGTMKMAFWY